MHEHALICPSIFPVIPHSKEHISSKDNLKSFIMLKSIDFEHVIHDRPWASSTDRAERDRQNKLRVLLLVNTKGV